MGFQHDSSPEPHVSSPDQLSNNNTDTNTNLNASPCEAEKKEDEEEEESRRNDRFDPRTASLMNYESVDNNDEASGDNNRSSLEMNNRFTLSDLPETERLLAGEDASEEATAESETVVEGAPSESAEDESTLAEDASVANNETSTQINSNHANTAVSDNVTPFSNS